MNLKQSRGFTLIEVMIVVAIIGLLASIAYPSYQDSLRKGRRAEAQSLLMDVANRQQQYLLDARTYADSLAKLNIVTSASVASHYDIAFDPTPTATSFTIVATPTGNQARDHCGTMTITQTGAKTPTTGCW